MIQNDVPWIDGSKGMEETLFPPAHDNRVNTDGLHGGSTGQGGKRSCINHHVTKATVGHLLGLLLSGGKEDVGSRCHLKALLTLPGIAGNPWPVTELHNSSSTGSFPFIHLIIMSGCQAGEPSSKELLRFYSKFCEFFSAPWLQMRLYIARVRTYRGTRQGRGENSGRVHRG